jgi:release factor glutamine methyltransferase
VSSVLAEIQTLLEAAGIESAADSQLLLGHVLGESRGRVQALAAMGSEISAEDHQKVMRLASERASRVPLQHLTGRAAFRGIELEVGPGVFVPRPETETVAQFAIDALLAVSPPEPIEGHEVDLLHPIAVDLCTGSGAIALALAHEVSSARVWAIEKSIEAHAWANRNVDRLGGGRVELLLGDVADARHLLAPLLGRVNVLISNPPYVPSGMVPRDPEVRDHDPELALYGGEDGLDLIRVISRVGLDLVAPGGSLVLEHAEQQGAAIRALLEADGWRLAATHQDLTLRDRATTAVR